MFFRTDFFVGPFLRVTAEVVVKQRQVGNRCPDPDCGAGEDVPPDACFCPRCGGETEPVLGDKDEWVDPCDGDDFYDEFVMSDNLGDPSTEEDAARRVKRFLYVSNLRDVPGG